MEYNPLQNQRYELMKNIALELSNTEVILKGGTGLMLCYGLDRFSEDMDFDMSEKSSFNRIKKVIDNTLEKIGVKYQANIKKDTETTKRIMYHYDTKELSKFPYPLKIEFSAREATEYSENNAVIINGIKVYKIDLMAKKKLHAFEQRCKPRDIYDISYLLNKYPSSFTQKNLNDIQKSNINDVFDIFEKGKKDDIILSQKDAVSVVLGLFQKVEELTIGIEKKTNNIAKQPIDPLTVYGERESEVMVKIPDAKTPTAKTVVWLPKSEIELGKDGNVNAATSALIQAHNLKSPAQQKGKTLK